MRLKGFLFKRFLLKTPTKELPKEEFKFKVKRPSHLFEWPKFKSLEEVDVTIPILEPFAYVRIKWDEVAKELRYSVLEPKLSEEEQRKLQKITEGLMELIEVDLSTLREPSKVSAYLEELIKRVVGELGIELSAEQYGRIMYYIYRKFVGYDEIDVLLRDPYIEDISCDGINIPLYVVHRKFGSIKTNITFSNAERLRALISKIAQRCGRYVSYAEPILAGTLPDGSRVSATLAGDVATRGPTFCIQEGFVQFKDGNLKLISDFFEELRGKAELEVENGIQILKPRGEVKVIGINSDLEQEGAKILSVMKLPPPEKLVDVVLEDGKKITVTPNHLFHILRDQRIELVKAEKLEEGDFVPVPTELKIKGSLQRIDLLKILEEYPGYVYVCVDLKIRKLIEKFVERYKKGKIKVLSERFHDALNKKASIPASIFLKICRELGIERVKDLKLVSTTGKGSKCTKVPSKVEKNLAYLIGLLISGGKLTKNYFAIKLYEREILPSIKKSLHSLFGHSKIYKDCLCVCNRFLAYYIHKVFEIPFGRKAKMRVPQVILKSSNEVVAAFLRGLFDGKGSVKSRVSLKISSRDLAYAIPFLLSRFGIYSFVKGGRGVYRLTVPSPYEKLFLQMIGFARRKLREGTRKGVCRKWGRVPNFKALKELLRKNDVKIRELLSLKIPPSSLYGKTVSRVLLKKVLSYLEKRNSSVGGEEFKFLKWLAESKNEWVKIKGVRVYENLKKVPVYDLELNPVRFFVGGLNGPLNLFDTIRKFTEKPFSPVDQMELGTASAEMLAYLWYLIEHRASILVIGGTATGKTSFLNTLSMFIPSELKIVSIEDTREIQLPHEHWIAGLTRVGFGIPLPTGEKYGEITLFDLLKESFRQKPDYVIVGEVRGAEAFVMFQGMASGHPTLSTFHAGDLGTVIKRLTTPPINLSPVLLESLDVVVALCMAHEVGKTARRVKEVIEILSVDPRTGEAMSIVTHRWDPVRDAFIAVTESEKIKTIAARGGLSVGEVVKEIEQRAEFLRWMQRAGKRDYLEVSKLINLYYKDRPAALALMGKELPRPEKPKVEVKERKSLLELLGFKFIRHGTCS